jgi:hypothetical protein
MEALDITTLFSICYVHEAMDIWPTVPIGCIVSIGTGVPAFQDIGRTLTPLKEAKSNRDEI